MGENKKTQQNNELNAAKGKNRGGELELILIQS